MSKNMQGEPIPTDRQGPLNGFGRVTKTMKQFKKLVSNVNIQWWGFIKKDLLIKKEK